MRSELRWYPRAEIDPVELRITFEPVEIDLIRQGCQNHHDVNVRTVFAEIFADFVQQSSGLPYVGKTIKFTSMRALSYLIKGLSSVPDQELFYDLRRVRASALELMPDGGASDAD